jgi:hypothetical protein
VKPGLYFSNLCRAWFIDPIHRAMVEEAGAGEMTSGLLGEYDGLKDARMARTPRTGPQGAS